MDNVPHMLDNVEYNKHNTGLAVWFVTESYI